MGLNNVGSSSETTKLGANNVDSSLDITEVGDTLFSRVQNWSGTYVVTCSLDALGIFSLTLVGSFVLAFAIRRATRGAI